MGAEYYNQTWVHEQRANMCHGHTTLLYFPVLFSIPQIYKCKNKALLFVNSLPLCCYSATTSTLPPANPAITATAVGRMEAKVSGSLHSSQVPSFDLHVISILLLVAAQEPSNLPTTSYPYHHNVYTLFLFLATLLISGLIIPPTTRLADEYFFLAVCTKSFVYYLVPNMFLL